MTECRPLVFGIGLNKTGTSTLNKALQILGWNAIHDAFSIPDQIQADRESGRSILSGLIDSGFNAFSDYPIFMHTRELLRAYPKAKFILTTRSFDDWFQSRLFHPGSTITWEMDRAVLLSQWQKHHNWVEQCFQNQTEKLLKLRICDGEQWQPLCQFLNCSVPTDSWPWMLRQNPYLFTQDEFTARIPEYQQRYRKWGGIPEKQQFIPGVKVLETTPREGRTTLWFLYNTCMHPTSRIFCLDQFESDQQRQLFQQNIAATGRESQVILISALEIDSNHEYDIVHEWAESQ